MLRRNNGLLLDVMSVIYANNYRFNDSHYAILIVMKQYATGNLLLSISRMTRETGIIDWNDWDYKDDWMAWMTGMMWTTKDD